MEVSLCRVFRHIITKDTHRKKVAQKHAPSSTVLVAGDTHVSC